MRNRLVCICFVTKPTKPIEWNLYLSILKLHYIKRATGVSALSTICSTGKTVYIQIIRTDLWRFYTLTGPPIRNNNSYAWNSCKQSTGKVKFILISYRLKLFTLIYISFSTPKISYLEPDIILSSGDVFYLTSAVSLEKKYSILVVFTLLHCRDGTWFCYFVLLTKYKCLVGNYQVCKYMWKSY